MSSERILEELCSVPCYHGQMDSTKAVELLKFERPGSFLIRSSTNPKRQGVFTISVIKSRTVKSTDIYHFPVLGSFGNYFAKKNKSFGTIPELLDFFRSNDYENHLNIKGIRLMYPIQSTTSLYSYATVQGRLENLMTHLLQMDEQTGEEMCECGILLRDASLPNGWMLHQTTTKPKRIFFQHEENNLTQWELPRGIWNSLTIPQKRLIRENLISHYPLD